MTDVTTDVTELQQRIVELEEEVKRLRQRNGELERAVGNAHENPKNKPTALMEEKEKETRQEVLEKIKSRVVSFNDLKPEWQDDIELVCATFDAFPRESVLKEDIGLQIFLARELAEGCYQAKYSELPYHLMVNEKVLVAALASQGGPKSWDDVPIWLRNNPAVISTALEYGTIEFENVPEELQFNHPRIAYIGVVKNKILADDVDSRIIDDNTWETAVKSGEMNWSRLPVRLQSNLNFARNVIREPPSFEFAKEIFRQMPALRYDETIWLRLLSLVSPHYQHRKRSFEPHHFQKLLEDFVPIELLSNHNFMESVCMRHSEAISLAERYLEMDEDSMAKVIKANVHVLMHLSHEAQLAHSHLIVEALPALALADAKGGSSMPAYYVEKNIAPSLWEDIEFARAWMNSGLGFPKNALDNATLWEWGEDRIISFTNATMNGNFYHTPRKLLKDDDFMLDVLDHGKKMNFEMYDDMCRYNNSPRIVIAVLAASREYTEKKMRSYHFMGKDETVKIIVRYVRQELAKHQSFSECVLGSMLSTKTFESTGTPLSLLNQGPETSLLYKRSLAEYLEVPTGKWLHQLRQADLHLRHAVAPWKSNV